MNVNVMKVVAGLNLLALFALWVAAWFIPERPPHHEFIDGVGSTIAAIWMVTSSLLAALVLWERGGDECKG